MALLRSILWHPNSRKVQQRYVRVLSNLPELETLSALLFECRLSELPLSAKEESSPCTPVLRSLDLAQAYQIQDNHGKALGLELGGFKVGGTSAEALVASPEPFRGLIPKQFVREIPAAGGLVVLHVPASADSMLVGVEAEWCFQLKERHEAEDSWRRLEEFNPFQYDVDALVVPSLLADVFPAIEVCMSRLGALAKSYPNAKIADGANGGYVVLGRELESSANEMGILEQKLAKLGTRGVKLSTGELVAEGSGRAVMSHPVWSLTWLINNLCKNKHNGGALGPGDLAGRIVMSGATTGTVPVKVGEQVKVEFEHFPSVTLEIRSSPR